MITKTKRKDFIWNEKFNNPASFLSSNCLKKSNDAVFDIQEISKKDVKLPVLTKDEFESIFLNYNYARFMVSGERDSNSKKWKEKSSQIESFLININMPLVVKAIKKFIKYSKNNDKYGEFMSLGYEGLLHAIRNFDISKGFQFSTYAFRCIRNSMYTNTRRKNVYLDPNGFDFSLLVSQSQSIDHEAQIKDEIEKLRIAISDEKSILSPIEKVIVLKRIMAIDGSPWTLQNIGETVGLTKERIRQIEIKAIEKIRKSFAEGSPLSFYYQSPKNMRTIKPNDVSIKEF